MLNDFIKERNLTNIIQVNDVDPVYYCSSPVYGDCVVKTMRDDPERYTGIAALNLYNDTGKMCRLYEHSEDKSVILIERIAPGDVLRDIPDVKQRAEIFCQVFDGFHIQTIESFWSYVDWVDNITAYMIEHESQTMMCELMQKAQIICHEMADKYPRKYLLHGDLHHDNILLNANGTYTVVDPKGVIGDPVFDTPRYLLNELSNEDNVIATAKVISDTFNIPLTDLIKLFFMEAMMSFCWGIESGDKDDSEMKSDCDAAINILSRYC